MNKLLVAIALSFPLGTWIACSDDDGSNVVPNPPPGAGMGGEGGSSASDAGLGGSGGVSGGAGAAGGGAGGAGSPGCTPVRPDAGASAIDAGELDGGLADAGGDAGDVESGDASVGLADQVSFATDIHPIFELSCGPCHTDLAYGGHNVGGELDAAYDEAVALGQTLVTRIDGGGMPPPNAAPPNDCGAQGRGSEPGDQGCLTRAEVALVQAWIDQCFPR
jgi:hypothetical protein